MIEMKRKQLLAFLVILFSFTIAYGQKTLVINLNDDAPISVPFSTIQKLTFNGDEMMLTTQTGAKINYLLDKIAYITFLNGEESGIQKVKAIIDVNVFMNNVDEIVAESPYKINQLTVFDITGKKVAVSSKSNMNVSSLNKGVYILQVATDKGLVSKKFIKNR